MFGKFKLTAAALLGGLFITAGTASAGVTVVPGQEYDGWTVAPETGVQLVYDGNGLYEKTAVFTRPATNGVLGGLLITFVQTDVDAAETIIIDNEALTNATGTPWGGFQFILFGDLASDGQASFVDGPNSPFASGNAIPGTPMALIDFQAQTITYANGYVPSPGVLLFTDGDLVINANPLDELTGGIGQAFTLKELPIAIPLPASAWTGLAGLAGIGLMSARKKIGALVA